MLTPLALYYYENPKDRKQKGQIILPSSDTTIRKGCSSVPDIKDKKLCFELVNNERCFLVCCFLHFGVMVYTVKPVFHFARIVSYRNVLVSMRRLKIIINKNNNK